MCCFVRSRSIFQCHWGESICYHQMLLERCGRDSAKALVRWSNCCITTRERILCGLLMDCTFESGEEHEKLSWLEKWKLEDSYVELLQIMSMQLSLLLKSSIISAASVLRCCRNNFLAEAALKTAEKLNHSRTVWQIDSVSLSLKVNLFNLQIQDCFNPRQFHNFKTAIKLAKSAIIPGTYQFVFNNKFKHFCTQ